jgi:hypothetical protein
MGEDGPGHMNVQSCEDPPFASSAHDLMNPVANTRHRLNGRFGVRLKGQSFSCCSDCGCLLNVWNDIDIDAQSDFFETVRAKETSNTVFDRSERPRSSKEIKFLPWTFAMFISYNGTHIK